MVPQRLVIQKRRAVENAIVDELVQQWCLPMQPATTTIDATERLVTQLNRMAGFTASMDAESEPGIVNFIHVLPGQLYFSYDILEEADAKQLPPWHPHTRNHYVSGAGDEWIMQYAVGWDTEHQNKMIATLKERAEREKRAI